MKSKFDQMFRIFIILSLALLLTDASLFAQDPSAHFQVDSDSKGILIPRMTTAQRNAIVNPATGLLVYDTDVDAFFVFTGKWESMGGNTLDQAYDEPTPGAGRLIIADTGAVEIHSDTMAFKLLDIGDSTNFALKNLALIEIKRPGNGLRVWHDHNGNAIEAVNSHSGTAIKAVHSGLGSVAKFETTTDLNVEPTVLITNKGASNALEVKQEDDIGSAGEFKLIDTTNIHDALSIDNQGKGNGIKVLQNGKKGSAVRLELKDTTNSDHALFVKNQGEGKGISVIQDSKKGNAVNIETIDSTNSEAALLVHHVGSGHGAEIKADSSFGVLGISLSPDFKKAGVRAKGMSNRDKAAALDVHDGAITVSGPARPAGRDTLAVNWVPIGDGDDSDLIGYSTFNALNNTLIDADRSVILLTPLMFADPPISISIISIADGSVVFKLGSLGPFVPASIVIVHYLIINDNGPN